MTSDQSGENVSLHTWKAYNRYFDNMTANENIFGLIFVSSSAVLKLVSWIQFPKF